MIAGDKVDTVGGKLRLVFGTGALHRLAFSRQRQALLRSALDAGFRAFDVAPAYGNGVGEIELGLAIRGERERCQINTKFGIPIPIYGAHSRHCFLLWRLADKVLGWSDRAYLRRDFSLKAMERSLNASLKRLHTDYVDTLFIHEPIADLLQSQMDSLVHCISDLKSKGKIRRFGIAGPRESIVRCKDLGSIDIYQTSWGDAEHLWDIAANRPVILYGTYAAFRSQNRFAKLSEFVRDQLGQHPNSSAILATNSPHRVRQLGDVVQ